MKLLWLSFYFALFCMAQKSFASSWMQVSVGYGAAAGTADLKNLTDKIDSASVSFLKRSYYNLTGELAFQSTSFLFDAGMGLSTTDRNMNFTQVGFGVKYYPTYANLLPSERPIISFGSTSLIDPFLVVGLANTSFDVRIKSSLGVEQKATVSGLGLLAGFGIDVPVGGNRVAGGRFSDWHGLVLFAETKGQYLAVATDTAGISSIYGTVSLGIRYRL